ncbi:thiol-disulfide oxidoreductase ResA [Lysinibacillus sp. JK80]|uniref:thiol-disulfide oxidoreductase ResA n=1 Tax=Lysinibacillus sp. JK80 TaxID=2749809 RepID=UPI0022B97A32|nr:thiol-disulfide oxidoreductase ResA [Lysinibacillus sp. JK80]WBF55052.1 thiol-disulfide oxidoreductase ResA [Lysinibacillus sp. JK80]
MDKKKRRFLMRSIILIILFGAIFFTVYTTLTQDKNEVLKIGDDAPNFTLVDMHGDKHNLEEYKGKGVFLNFWGTWCKPCEREFPIIDRYYNDYKEKDIQVLAINIAESDFVVQNYIDRKGLTFPVLIDKNKSVMEAYNINPLPTTILINSEGKIEKIITGEMKEQDIKNYMELILPD